MTERARRVRHIREALALRAEVMRYLASDVRSVERLSAATPAAWRLLLRHECCALPLIARFRADDVLAHFAPDVQECLAAAEAAEVQRVLAARLLIRELDMIAEQAGVRFTLLKGAAIAADPACQPLDLGDVDLLAPPESIERAWRALLAAGWSPAAPGLLPTDELGQRLHYAPLCSERHQLPLELHPRFDYLATPEGVDHSAEATPIPGYRYLDRLAGPRAIAATLRHSVVVHPHRRGHLRDLFHLAVLLRELDAEQSNALERDLRGDGHSVELLAMLAQSRALAHGDALTDPVVLRRFVALKYAAEARTSRLLGVRSDGWYAWHHVVLERPAARRAAYRRLLRGATEPIDRDWLPLQHPALGSRLARSVGLPRIVRVARRVGLVIALIAAGGMIRRHIAGLTKAPKGVD